MNADKVNARYDNTSKRIEKTKKPHGKPKCVNGYLILFDIVDSTKRKTEYVRVDNHWTTHIQTFYSDFVEFSSGVVNSIKDEQFLKGSEIVKVIGDMGFLFLPFKPDSVISENKKAIPNVSKLILEKVVEFVKIPSTIPELKLKTIISYIYDVYIVNLSVNDNNNKDIVGTGIDFSFRLETFANSSCLVLNKYFYNSITEYLDINKGGLVKKNNIPIFGKNDTYVYKSQKVVKGWQESQEFYFLTNTQMIENAFKDSESSKYENSLSVDLFAKYIQYKN